MRSLFLLACFPLVFSAIIPKSEWKPSTNLPYPISDMTSVVVDNRIYVAGGCIAFNQSDDVGCTSIGGQMLMLEKGATSWAVQTPMLRTRYRYAAAAVGSLIYYVGGRTDMDTPVTAVDIYNTATQIWSTLANQTCMNCIPASDSAAFVIDTKLYVSGGYSASYDLLNSTAVLDTSVALAQQQFRGDLVPTRTWAAGDNGAVTVNGLGYVMGGFGENFCAPLTKMSAYDPKTNTWTNKTPFSEGRGDFAVATIGKYIYVIGGETKAAGCTTDKLTKAVPVADVERYDITTNRWEEYSPIAFTRFRFPSAAVEDVLFDIGGQGEELLTTPSFPVLSDVFVLNATQYDIAKAKKGAASLDSPVMVMVAVCTLMAAFL